MPSLFRSQQFSGLLLRSAFLLLLCLSSRRPANHIVVVQAFVSSPGSASSTRTVRSSSIVIPLLSSTTSTTTQAQTIASPPPSFTNFQEDASSSNNNKKKKDQHVMLTFSIDLVHESEPLQVDNDFDDALRQAWEESASVRHGLITPNPIDSQLQEFTLTEAQRHNLQECQTMWWDSSDNVGISSQTTTTTTTINDSAPPITGLRFTTGAVQFPGLTVDSTVTAAVLRGGSTDDSGNNWITPPYTYHVLDTVNTATGRRPMVWLFEQMVRRNPPVSRSVTQAGLVRKHETGAVVLRYHSRAIVTSPISRSLLRFLPATQAQTEQWGSAALQSAVLQEVQACMQTVRPYLEEASQQ